jgi:hypothetical protein
MAQNCLTKDCPKKRHGHGKKLFWSIMIVLGIIGSGVSLLIIPLSFIPIIIGVTLFLTGLLIIHYTMKDLKFKKKQMKNSITTYNTSCISDLKNHCYIGLTLIFSGFILAWVFSWFMVICYFRYSSFMFAVYL